MGAEVPFHRINKFDKLFKKYLHTQLPCANTFRYNEAPAIYEDILNLIRQRIGNDDIYMMIDETSDRREKLQVSLFGLLDSDKILGPKAQINQYTKNNKQENQWDQSIEEWTTSPTPTTTLHTQQPA